MTDISETLVGMIEDERRNKPAQARDTRYLFGPVMDFLFLGGASLIILPLVFLYVPIEKFDAFYLIMSIYLINVINHPHFIHSYQLFYENFRTKLFSPEHNFQMRSRFFVAGIVVPVVLTGFFLFSYFTQNVKLVVFSVNAMIFFVGWHYVKQGYGMAIVDSVLKKAYYSNREKKILLVTSYISWICTWLIFNDAIRESDYHGVKYYAINIPEQGELSVLMILLACCLFALRLFINKAFNDKGKTPYNGMIAYFVSIYIWLLVIKIDPICALLVPAFHGLQYIIVVWRFQLNRLAATRAEKTAMTIQAVMPFFLSAVVIGFVLLFALPIVLQQYVKTPDVMQGIIFFPVAIWVTVNIQHYFMDNVIWRKENAEVRKYLFGAPK